MQRKKKHFTQNHCMEIKQEIWIGKKIIIHFLFLFLIEQRQAKCLNQQKPKYFGKEQDHEQVV